jgi:hypothetical protein
MGQVKNSWYPYGKNKGWLLGCELMPGHHGNEIEAAEDMSDIPEA